MTEKLIALSVLIYLIIPGVLAIRHNLKQFGRDTIAGNIICFMGGVGMGLLYLPIFLLFGGLTYVVFR